MDLRTISVVALSARDFSSLDEKLAEAVRWLELAAGQGAELVVFPECLNRFCGDGAANPHLQTAGSGPVAKGFCRGSGDAL
jgi:predicted amidohydrolase